MQRFGEMKAQKQYHVMSTLHRTANIIDVEGCDKILQRKWSLFGTLV